MKIKGIYINLFVVSLVVGILISIQIKVINIENNGMNTYKKGEQLQLELKVLKEREEELKNEIDNIKEKIDEYKYDEGNEIQKKIAKEISKYEELAGYTNVEGEGVEIRIESINEDMMESGVSQSISYNYDLILSIINKLNSAQANAISINNQRVISNTYIKLEGEYISINEIDIKEPFIIKAIGNKDTLESALKIKYGIIWEIKKHYSAKVIVHKKDNVQINGYSQKIQYDHLQEKN